MTLAAGTYLGPYEVLGPLGAGGMGEVYRARDTRLGRDVAVKVLPQHLSTNPEVRARFEREAKTVSSLSHPHICTLHDIGREGDTDYLVMELIEGETLASRLARGALPLVDVLKFGAQIADALDRAHRAGVMHRDLKPGNVMLTRSGAKLMDFGLARATGPEPAGALSTSQTVAEPLTAQGTIIGTYQYMAPEQLEGKEADARADLWALGCVLFEMATGGRAFEGGSHASLIASIMHVQPAPVSHVAPVSPPALDRLVAACLAKDPTERIQSAHDVKLQLGWIAEGGSQAGTPAPVATPRRGWGRGRLGWVVAALLAVVAGWLAIDGMRCTPAPRRAFRATIMPPSDTALIPFDLLGLALSADGARLAFVANGADGSQQIWVRDLGETTAKAIPETRGAAYPFWSPDGQYLGFFADGKLKKVDLRGGSPQVLADAPSGRGGSWSRDDVILYSPKIRSAILSVPAAGGTPKAVTLFDEKVATTHRWPAFLPDGRHFVYLVRGSNETGRAEMGRLMLASLDAPEATALIDDATNTAYVAPGYLIYGRDATLYAWRFDASKLKLIGKPAPIGDQKASLWEPKNFVPFAAADNGTLVFLPDASRKSTLQWIGRDGRPLGTLGEPAYHQTPRISPDGKKVAFSMAESATSPRDIWIADLEYDRRFRLTQKSGLYFGPKWSHDSTRLAFVCAPKSVQDLCVKSLLGGGDVEVLHESPLWKTSGSWLPGDKALLFDEQDPETSEDIKLLPLDGEREPRVVLRTPFFEGDPEASRDGRWMAYVSRETGRDEVCVRELSGSDQQWQISTSGGRAPRWRADGRELFYLASDGHVMSVAIDVAPVFRAGAPQALLKLPEAPDRDTPVFEDVTPDGQRLLLDVPVTTRSSVGFSVILNWMEMTKDR